jgi:N-dimethylarginine dimethylaminohydrolase
MLSIGEICLAWPKNILMVSPNHFRIDYAINPYMTGTDGKLNCVDTATANQQWHALKETFERVGLHVTVLPGQPDFPDMVFCANQTLPFADGSGQKHLVISRMRSNQREGETAFFSQWAAENGWHTHQVTDYSFEGCGDAIWNYERGELWGGYGFRSGPEVYDWLADKVQAPIFKLQLQDEHFYHLDTCFLILGADKVAYVPEAFHEDSRRLIESKFQLRIAISKDEAKNNFAGNAFCIDGRHVVLQSGSTRFCDQLRKNGFVPVEVETREFMKSGGSVFCLKQVLL